MTMEKEQSTPKQSDPIIIETAGMRIAVDYRRGVGGDEGLTFDLTVAGEKETEREFSASTVSTRRRITTSARRARVPFMI